MKSIIQPIVKISAIILLLACTSHANAQTHIKPFAGIGLTRGGDEVNPKVQGENYYRPAKVSGFLHAYIGGLYMPTSDQAFSLSLGFQGGTVKESGERKRYEFSRFPLEAAYRRNIFGDFGFGVGLRKSLGTKVRMPNAERAYEPDINSDLGYFGEVRFGLGEDFSLFARYTIEKFKVSNVGKVDGNHAGLYIEFAR